MTRLPFANPAPPFESSARRRLLRRLGRLSPVAALAASLLLLGVIALLDYAIGDEIVFTSLDLLPVSIVAWYAGRRWGAAVAVLTTAVWLATNLSAGLRYSQLEIYAWNSFMTLGPLVVAAYLDLDSFKLINDQLGHRAGDEVLRAVATAMADGLRAGEAVARVGGDEFGLLLPDTDQGQAQMALERMRRQVLEAMGVHHWPVTLSIGVVVCRGPAASADEALRLADALMYEAKLAGKNAMHFGELPAPAPLPEGGRAQA